MDRHHARRDRRADIDRNIRRGRPRGPRSRLL